MSTPIKDANVSSKDASLDRESPTVNPIDGDLEDAETVDVKLLVKKNGKVSPFTSEQLAYIDSYFAAFELLLRKHKLHLGKSGKEHDPLEVSDWINKTVDHIINSEKFKGKLDERVKTPKQWKTVGLPSPFINDLY